MGFKLSNKEELRKSAIRPEMYSETVAQGVNTNKAVFSAKQYNSNFQAGVITKSRRLQDKDLVLFSQTDAVVSAIITTRHSEVTSFGRRSRSQYENGIILRDISQIRKTPNKTRAQVESEVAKKDALSSLIYSWILNCGTTNQTILDTVFAASDHYFKHCTLAEFFGAQARNLLQCGRMATQLIRNVEGAIIMFRPVPVETIFQYRKGQKIVINKGFDYDIPQQVLIDIEKYNSIPDQDKPTVWVQRINEKIVSFFTEKDLRIDYWQKQAVANLDGYPLAPLELAISALQQHYNAQQYMNNNLIKGLGSKGFFTIKPLSTEQEAIDYLPSDKELETIRKDMQRYMAGSNQNSAINPIFTGPFEVDYKSLNATAKDMEFLRLYDYTITLLCTSFQIFPEEIGFAGIRSNSGDDKAGSAQSKGLASLLTALCGSVTQIVWETFPDAKDALQIEPTGLGKSSRMDDLKISKEMLQTSGDFADLWANSEKDRTFPFGGEVPTSPIFHQYITRYMKMSEIRYHFLKIDADENNPDMDFFVDVGINASYQAQKSLRTGGGGVVGGVDAQPKNNVPENNVPANEDMDKSTDPNETEQLLSLMENSEISPDELENIIEASISEDNLVNLLSEILPESNKQEIDPQLIGEINRLLT